jgi:hypothetical protein
MRYCAEIPVNASPSSARGNDHYVSLYQAVQDLPWRRGLAATEIPARALGTLLVFCYARELYSSTEIALQAVTDRDLQYICTRHVPDLNELRSFRRANRPLIEHALATYLRSRGSSTIGSLTVLGEAKRRVDLAVRSDCFELDV